MRCYASPLFVADALHTQQTSQLTPHLNFSTERRSTVLKWLLVRGLVHVVAGLAVIDEIEPLLFAVRIGPQPEDELES